MMYSYVPRVMFNNQVLLRQESELTMAQTLDRMKR